MAAENMLPSSGSQTHISSAQDSSALKIAAKNSVPGGITVTAQVSCLSKTCPDCPCYTAILSMLAQEELEHLSGAAGKHNPSCSVDAP